MEMLCRRRVAEASNYIVTVIISCRTAQEAGGTLFEVVGSRETALFAMAMFVLGQWQQ